MLKKWVIIWLAINCTLSLKGQDSLSNKRIRSLAPTTAWQLLDSQTVVPYSLTLLPPTEYEIRNNQIRLINPVEQTYTASFRVFPFDLQTPVLRLDTAMLTPLGDIIIGPYFPGKEEDISLPEFGKLDYNGSFSRGLSFGNSQNLVLNSNLNLQMAGRLTNDVEVLAAITDNSIPIQPEGNTAQLQEFDKVFVQLKRKQASLIAGDYELRRPNSYFMNYFKKLQGATFQTKFPVSSKGTLSTKASAAIAKGKFARNIIQSEEGNQGPYRLQGNEGERFIIILSGTEKVFLDGAQLKRGLQADYVIDYNSASLTFTANRLITKDSRIVIEYDYTDLSYLRSLMAVDLDYQSEKVRVYFNAYTDQDSKNSIADGELNESEKIALRQAGDSDLGAVVPGLERQEEFNPLRVTYRLVDTMICGFQDSILLYDINPETGLYTARFSLVGQGNGNYRLAEEQAANGRVYEWVPLVNCIPQGDYAPVIRLAAPRQQQLYTLGTEVKVTEKGQIRAELALSNLDANRFSSLENDDNLGAAGFINYEQNYDLGRKDKDWQLSTSLNYEYVNRDFNFLAPYRSPEFTRDWNLSQALNGQIGNSIQEKAEENLAGAELGISKKDWGRMIYRFGGFWRDDIYTGNRHGSQIRIQRNGYEAELSGSYLQSENEFEKTQFFRPKLLLAKSFQNEETDGNWRLGITAQREQNRRESPQSDTLLATSFFYDQINIFAERQESKNFTSTLGILRRWDYLPDGGAEFLQSSIGDELNWQGSWLQSQQSRLFWNLSYRQLQVQKTSAIASVNAETYLGNINYKLQLWKGTLRSTTGYEVGSGQEPKIEFNYLQVNDGEGVYQWKDYNDDGVAQQNEFEISVFQDSANFVRVSNLTGDFIRSNNVVFNQSLQLEPRAIWQTSEGWRKLLSRLSLLSTWQITRKVRDVEGVSQWNPFQLNIADTALVASNYNIRNTLFLNRADPVYDVQFGYNVNQNRVVITTGFESRKLIEQFFQTRYNIARSWTIKGLVQHRERTNLSENFNNRTYRIDSWKVEPSISWQGGTSYRTVLSFAWQQGDNLEGTIGEQVRSQGLNLEGTFNFSDKSKSNPLAIRLRTTFAKVEFTGVANSPVGFAMLDGLRQGRNFLWNISLDRQVLKNIRMNISYEGRKTGDSGIVHVGRAQVGAVF